MSIRRELSRNRVEMLMLPNWLRTKTAPFEEDLRSVPDAGDLVELLAYYSQRKSLIQAELERRAVLAARETVNDS